MDDTQASSRADAANATRKRRSSILKNQRPRRTPFSEVEFNVATPTDTPKSRRVSFSRRTGVAEFITNEATTTWKNFYEEHNKSLETSGNDSVANAPRQTIEHIGKYRFDQQFEEVEVIEETSHANNPLKEFKGSFNNINLTQQLASLECMTGNLNFPAPQSKFEQSALTELSKPFGNEIHVPILEDMTNPFSMNFSDKCDDVDEIQKDLERSKPSDMCPGPMRVGTSFSGFIEVVNLNVTRGVIHNDGSEMSITDTIGSPKVHEISRNDVTVQNGNLSKFDNDWTNDKENIAINPYVAPKESLNFEVNEDSDEVLVFDGKRLRTQSISTKIPEADNENFCQTLLHNAPTIATAPQRKTIILNLDKDLPNFIESNSSESHHVKNDLQQEKCNNVNIITTAMDNQIKRSNITDIATNKLNITFSNVLNKQNTTYQNEISNIYFTQSIPSHIISTTKEAEQQNKDFAVNKTQNNTILYGNMTQDISMTQAIPNNIIHLSEEKEKKIDKLEKRKTIIFNSDSCDISMTQALPGNIKINTNVYQSNTPKKEIVKEFISKEKRNTIIFSNDACDISMTQALPTNINLNTKENDYESYSNTSKKEAGIEIISKEKRNTIIFANDACDISMTQALPTNINLNTEENDYLSYSNTSKKETGKEIISKEKRNTIIFANDACDISMTQALPTNINLNTKENDYQSYSNSSKKEIISKEKRNTIIFNNDACDISMTQALPTNINLNTKENDYQSYSNTSKKEIISKEKRNTIIFNNDACDISMTQALPTNINLNTKENDYQSSNNTSKKEIISKEKRNTIIFNNDACDISMTQALPTNINLNTKENDYQSYSNTSKKEIISKEKRNTIIFNNDACDISMTQALPTNIHKIEIEEHYLIDEKLSRNEISTGKRKTIIFDNDDCNISITQALPTNINFIKNESNNVIIIENSKEASTEKRKTIIFDNDSDISMTLTLPANINVKEKIEEKRKTVVLNSELERENKTTEHDNNFADISSTSVNHNTQCIRTIQDSNKKTSEYLDVSSSVKPGCNSISVNVPSLVYDNTNRITVIDNDNNKSLLHWAALENINVTLDDNKHSIVTNPIPTNIIDIQKDVAFNIRTSENILKIEQNETSFHEISAPELNKHVLIYQVNTNQQTKEINIDRNNDDLPKIEVSPSINNETNYEEALLKFSNDEDENATSGLEDRLEKHYLEDAMSKSVKEKTFSDNLHQTNSRDNKSKPKKSILNELLDMSCESITDKHSGIEQSNDIIGYNVETVNIMKDEISTSIPKEQLSELNCKESFPIFISDKETVTTSSNNVSSDLKPIVTRKTENNNSVIYMENGTNENSMTIQGNSEEFKAQGLRLIQKNSEDQELKDKNAEYEIELDRSVTVIPDDLNYSKGYKSFRNADNTKELLQMLSHFTDEGGEKSVTVEKDSHMEDLCEETPAEPAEVDGEMICEIKNNIQEPKRLSLAPRRQSIVISREDLLNNISMATAILQQSRFNVDESESTIMDDTSESIHEHESSDPHNHIHRVCSEVVKTLQFEDESVTDTTDTDITSERKISPLKKTLLGDTNTNEDKAKVIPTYIKDVSDDIKELMRDLVKPTADMPFSNVLGMLPSTCSMEVQANLTTSSQIDVGVELHSNCDSVFTVKDNKDTFISFVNEESSFPQQTNPERILVFNHDNPLKNIQLPLMDCSDAHEYNELKMDITNPVQSPNKCRNKDNDTVNQSTIMYMEVNKNTTNEKPNKLGKPIQNDLDVQTATQTEMQLVDACVENSTTLNISNVSQPLLIDRSVESIKSVVKDTEVNTVIVMKENKELLRESSSLTLVEGRTDSEGNIGCSSVQSAKCTSPVRVIFKNGNESKFILKDSDATSYEELSDVDNVETKPRKRSYSPTHRDSCTPSNVDVTPKSNSKMQKMSSSPLPKSMNNKGEELVTDNTSECDAKSFKLAHQPSTKVNETKTLTKIAKKDVQGNHSKLNVSTKVSHKSSLDIHTIISQSDIKSLGSTNSSMSEMQDPSMTISQVLSSVTSQISGVSGEKKIERNSSADIVETINMLSFMGSTECEWDCCGDPNEWRFRLMRGRLRLRTHLARRGDVRADTPLTDIDVEIVQTDDKDSLVALCVVLAAEAMRYEAARLVGPAGAARAEDVATLLRRCVALSRLARRWARVMNDARMRLGYNVLPDGLITLKVANLPLRCVWEVRMRVTLEVGSGRASAFPRARDLCVAAVLPRHAPPPAELRRLACAQPPDWGHAPRTLWKVYKYLKNRTRDKDLLGI